MGTGSNIMYKTSDTKTNILNMLNETNNKLNNVLFNNTDYRKFMQKISHRHGDIDRKRSFIYADKPYSNTGDNYSNDWAAQDDIDLLDVLDSTYIKYAVSEFEGSHFEKLALEKGLNKIVIGERRNIKNRRTEILITNYETERSLFD